MPSPLAVHTFNLGPLDTNCHLLAADGQAVVVDPGGDPAEVVSFLKKNSLTLTHILVTHIHFDHIYGCKELTEATGAPVLVPAGDMHLFQSGFGRGGMWGFPPVPLFPCQPLEPGDIELLGRTVHVLPVPGHTPGSLAFHFPDSTLIVAGDLIFYRSVGRTDFPDGSFEDLGDSIRNRIFTLPEDTVIYTGHGLETSVGDEKRHNPFVSEFGL